MALANWVTSSLSVYSRMDRAMSTAIWWCIIIPSAKASSTVAGLESGMWWP